MQLVAGLIVIGLSVLGWAGQAISWVAPRTAENLGLTERQEAVEPVYHADIRGEAAWDTFSLWTMVVAGVLLAIDEPAWAYFGLVGGGMFVYFAGRGIVTRTVMIRRGFRIGTDANVRIGFAFLAIWGMMALIVVIAAARTLSTG